MNALPDALVGPDHHNTRLPRFDMYGPIHKAVRRFMNDTLQRVGALDIADDAEFAGVLEQVGALLAGLRGHVKHENDFVHAAIEARRPAGARHTAEEHAQHLATIGGLEEEAAALGAAPREQREARTARLYRHLALFVAENLQHMHVEETANNALLWSHYSDDELVEIHDRLVASIAPEELMGWLRWMVPSLTPNELTGVLGDMRAKAPPQVFAAILETVRECVDAGRWSRLVRWLGVAQGA